MVSSTCISCLFATGIFVSLILAIAGVFGIIFGPKVIQNQVVKQLPLSADSDKLDSWINQPVPTYIQFWLWECVNPDDVVQQGRKPMVVQRGPFTYIENKTKTDVFFNPNLTVSFRQPTSYTFVRHMSADDDSLPVVMINTPIITILNIARNLSKPTIYEDIVNLIAKVFNETLFVKRTANEWIWGYEEPLFKAVKKIPIVGPLIPDDHFGYFYGRNATDGGLYTVFTGENDINRLNYINKWNGGSYLTYWNSTQSNQINGTDGSWFPPLSTNKLQSERLYVFSTDVCRSIYLTFDGHSSVLNIPTETFSIPAEVLNNATLNPENAGFGNLDSGVLNVSTCQQGAPIILSFPHFLYAAEHYQAHIDGLAPDADAHRTVLQIEPHTGFVFNAQERIQINVYIEHDPLFDGLKNVPTLIMPAVWINESTVIDQKTADDFKSEVLRIFTIIRWLSIGLAIFGTIALFTVLLFLTKRQRQQKPRLLYAGLNNEPVSKHDEVDSAALKMISQLSQAISGKSHVQFPIIFEPTQIGLYQLSLLYIINNFYQHYVKVIIDVCLPTIQLSTDKLLIRSLPHILAEDSFRKVVHLYNPLNAPAKFRWIPIIGSKGTTFSIHPATGAIEPYQTVDNEITDSSPCVGEHEQEIYMTGEVIEPNLNIPESEINYGDVSILMKASKQFHSDNKISYFFTN
ncbi:unnamed protein product [Rotaria sp. Silwood1]|nr:unnamed protein product [Rotaria sp. Silwood1]